MKVAARRLAIAFGFAALLNANAEAQVNQGPLTLVVGQAPGGTTDTLARLLAEKLGPKLGRNVIVDIKAGAGGTIAAGAVARAKADGNTLLFTASGHSTNPFLDVTSGRVPIAFDNIALMGPYIADGRLKPLAITAKQRSPSYPNVPTMIESGYADFDIVGWFGVMAPSATPSAILDALSKAIVEIKGEPAFGASVAKLGAQMIPGDRRDAETFVQGDLRKMGAMIKDLAITAN
jgi:tripartite-type tricarboxylate transporter receptor subunit TctC